MPLGIIVVLHSRVRCLLPVPRGCPPYEVLWCLSGPGLPGVIGGFLSPYLLGPIWVTLVRMPTLGFVRVFVYCCSITVLGWFPKKKKRTPGWPRVPCYAVSGGVSYVGLCYLSI